MYAGMKQWEKDAMTPGGAMQQQAVTGVAHVRMNCTIRWRDRHIHPCPVYESSRAVGGTQSTACGFKPIIIGGAEPVLTGAVQAT